MTLVEFLPERMARMRAYSYHEHAGGPVHVMRYRDVDPQRLSSVTAFNSLMTLVELEFGHQAALIRGPQRSQIVSTDLKWGRSADERAVLYGVYVPDVETGLMMLHMGFSI